jgi:DNA-binding transcriptional MerR regulator
MQKDLYEISEAAYQLGVSVDVIKRFIRMGLVFPVNKQGMKLTRYGIRRLKTVLDLYEKSYPLERIESVLNH